MTDYPYSQQIHDKILNDWKDIPFDEWNFNSDVISHPKVDYLLYYKCPDQIWPNDMTLWGGFSTEHRDSLYIKLMKEPMRLKREQELTTAVKQFLGLN